MNYYVVTYKGPFGFIKPWTAVRDGQTFSQQFLTPSTIEGIRQLFGVETIFRHKLAYNGMSDQTERIQAPDYEIKKITGRKGWQKIKRNQSILTRGVLLSPVLHLAFATEADAQIATQNHLCLCRNEDLLFPAKVGSFSESDFNALTGFELRFGQGYPQSFLVGFNRYDNASPMYGAIEITGSPSTYTDE